MGLGHCTLALFPFASASLRLASAVDTCPQACLEAATTLASEAEMGISRSGRNAPPNAPRSVGSAVLFMLLLPERKFPHSNAGDLEAASGLDISVPTVSRLPGLVS